MCRLSAAGRSRVCEIMLAPSASELARSGGLNWEADASSRAAWHYARQRRDGPDAGSP